MEDPTPPEEIRTQKCGLLLPEHDASERHTTRKSPCLGALALAQGDADDLFVLLIGKLVESTARIGALQQTAELS